MALILWHRVVFGDFLRVSNDIFAGSLTLDAEISIELREGPSAASFTIRIPELPAYAAEQIRAKRADAVRAREPLTVAIHLGYFERFPVVTSKTAVLRGAITGIRSRSEDGRTTTEISGQDVAAFKLLALRRVEFTPRDRATPADAVRFVLERAGVEQTGELAGRAADRNRIVRAPNGLAAIGLIAERAGSRFAVRDGSVHWPAQLPALPDIGPAIAADVNVVRLDGELRGEPARAQPGSGRANDRPAEQTRNTIRVTMLGDPALRPGQLVPFAARGAPVTLHVNQVTHTYGSRGYLCDVVLEEDGSGSSPRPASGAARIVERFRELVSGDARPGIDVGEISAYDPGSRDLHLASVNYGQRPRAETVAPSVETPVEREQQLLQRPIAAPFAWHRCGLIVPAYPGQRTLLSHNRGDANDVVLHGYVWAENPLMERPRNEPGDWWLCLPTEVRDDRPTGRAANDLTDAAGLRVIQARGLTISIGAGRLAPLGDRPDVPSADTLTIEHASGTTISIAADGAVEIRTDGKALRLTDGSNAVAIGNGAVEIS